MRVPETLLLLSHRTTARNWKKDGKQPQCALPGGGITTPSGTDQITFCAHNNTFCRREGDATDAALCLRLAHVFSRAPYVCRSVSSRFLHQKWPWPRHAVGFSYGFSDNRSRSVAFVTVGKGWFQRGEILWLKARPLSVNPIRPAAGPKGLHKARPLGRVDVRAERK